MGTRIRKRLGYGYVTPVDAEVTTTDMLNLDSFLFKEEASPFKNKEEATEDYLAFAQQWSKDHADTHPFLMDPLMMKQAADEGKPGILDLFGAVGRSDDEFSSNHDVFILTPFGMLKEWYRFDDMIDYIEDMNFAQNYSLEEDVRVLPDGIWPHSGTYIRLDTGERVNNQIMDWIRGRNNKDSRWTSMDRLAQLGGFESDDEAQRLVAAKPSDDAIVLALWAQVFKNPEDAYRMKSIYYKCWR